MTIPNIKKVYLFKFLIQFHLVGGVLIPFFTIWGGLNLAQTLLIQSWFLIWSLLLEVPTGLIADIFGKRKSLYLAGLVGTLAIVVYTSVPVLPVFLMGEFLFAMSTALLSGADEAFLYETLKTEHQEKEIGKYLAQFESWGLAGLMISAPIGSIVGSWLGPRFAVMLMVIPFFLAFLVGLTLHEPPKEKTREAKRYLDILIKGLAIIRGRRKIQWIAIDLAVVHSLTFLMIWLYQPLLMANGLSMVWLGFVHSANSGIQIVIMNNYGKLKKFLGGIENLLGLTAFLPGILFIIAGSVKALPLAIIAIVLSLGFGLTRRPLVSQELNQMIPSIQRATVLSSVMLSRRILSAILNPIVGELADRSLSNTFIIIGICLLAFSGLRYLVLTNYAKRSNVR